MDPPHTPCQHRPKDYRRPLDEARIDLVARQKRALEKEVKILEGLLPICGFCKKIRDEEGHWHSLEGYITNHSEATFTTGFCPDCGKVHYPQFYKEVGTSVNHC